MNFTVHVTGVPHGCEGGEQSWDAQQQSTCPTRISNHRTDYYANFSMMLWNGDDDNDGVPNSWDLFPLDANETKDSDGDGVGDNADAFPNDANETADTDGDGVGDNADQCPASEEGVTVDKNGCVVTTDSDGDGVIDGEDQCPDENASLLDEDGDGCLDDEDGDGVLDSDDACPLTELDETVDETGCSEGQLSVMDDDNDGVSTSTTSVQIPLRMSAWTPRVVQRKFQFRMVAHPLSWIPFSQAIATLSQRPSESVRF